MSVTIKPLSKIINASEFDLAAAAFDQTNYRSSGAPQNDTLSSDTPKGVLGGSVAGIGSANWQATAASYDGAAGTILGLFAGNSEGNAFENSPAASSGVVPIYMGVGSLLSVYVFETHSSDSPYGSILADYTLGALLYVSVYGLLTNEAPASLADNDNGVNNVVALVTKVPTATDLTLGIKLLV